LFYPLGESLALFLENLHKDVELIDFVTPYLVVPENQCRPSLLKSGAESRRSVYLAISELSSLIECYREIALRAIRETPRFHPDSRWVCLCARLVSSVNSSPAPFDPKTKLPGLARVLEKEPDTAITAFPIQEENGPGHIVLFGSNLLLMDGPGKVILTTITDLNPYGFGAFGTKFLSLRNGFEPPQLFSLETPEMRTQLITEYMNRF
jgi:hypothetical protein